MADHDTVTVAMGVELIHFETASILYTLNGFDIPKTFVGPPLLYFEYGHALMIKLFDVYEYNMCIVCLVVYFFLFVGSISHRAFSVVRLCCYPFLYFRLVFGYHRNTH